MSSQGRNFIKHIKGQAITGGTQRNLLRLPDIEQAMEYEDNSIDVHRYPSHVAPDEPKQRKRTQPRKLGAKAKTTKKGL